MAFFRFNKNQLRAEFYQANDSIELTRKINRGIAAAPETRIADATITGAGAGRNFVALFLYTDQRGEQEAGPPAGRFDQPGIPTFLTAVACIRDSTEQGLTAQVTRAIELIRSTPLAGNINAIEVAGSSDAQTYIAMIVFQAILIQQAEIEGHGADIARMEDRFGLLWPRARPDAAEPD